MNLLNGEFPDLSGIFAEDKERNVIELNKKEIKEMMERMSILTSEDYKGVIFKFEDGLLEITTANPELGESKEDMEIDFKGEKIEALFNPHFFIDTLNFIESEKIFLTIVDDESPCLIHGQKDKSFLSAIMPMKI